ncbi:MAG: protein of unknown function endonuclease [Actinomycetia bacterium]|nr:protein of unknown function endonuclease [Actinomycetes bacterium]
MFGRLRERAMGLVLEQLRRMVRELDAALLTGPQAVRLLDWFAEIERLAAAGKALVAGRAAETNQWRSGGDRSAAEWLGKRTGTTPGQARKALETADRVKALPKTSEALREGRLSIDQAALVSDGATADPGAEDELLRAAGRESVRELRGRTDRVKAAALPDDEARHEAIRRRRSAREFVGDDGAWNLHLHGTKDEGAVFMAHARPFIDAEFKKARKEGRREPIEAYAFDGMMRMAVVAAGGGSPAKSPVKAILRADLPAVRRGSVEPGEVCEMVGYGPIPVARARELLGEAFLTIVLTKGKDVVNVTHLGRAPTAYQQTALEWMQPECQVLGCSCTARLERDHREDWAWTHHTRLDELEHMCHQHHLLKTKGWHLEPGTGKRRLLPPEVLVDAGAEPP